MLNSLKKKFQKSGGKDPTKESWIQTLSTREKAIAGMTAALSVVSLGGLMMFNPGLVSGVPNHDNHAAAIIPQMTKSTGPMRIIQDPSKNPSPDLGQQPLKLPTSLPSFSGPFGGTKIPFKLPGFTPPSGSIPLPGSGMKASQQPFATPEYMTKAYAVHAAKSSSMRGVLDDGFVLENMSDAPSGAGANRFVTTYAAKNASGTVLEKMELVTIARSADMAGIKTADDALYGLVEDSGSINIIEDNGSYLVFDISGSKGYQLTRLEVRDDAIVFAAYVNMTTNLMPSALRDEWASKLASL